jgi:uncharacterized protein YecE (DUF72 family)
MPGRILVGTSSWADPGFVEDWYPPGLPARDRLPWYAERFEAVELNSSFYALPKRETVERWARVTPPGFTFEVKLHRLLSRHSAPLDSLPPDAVTSDRLAFFRAHGRNTEGYLKGKTVAERFGWVYADGELREIAGRVESLAEEVPQVTIMFNNNRSADAPTAARRFRELIGQDPGPAPEPTQQQLG